VGVGSSSRCLATVRTAAVVCALPGAEGNDANSFTREGGREPGVFTELQAGLPVAECCSSMAPKLI